MGVSGCCRLYSILHPWLVARQADSAYLRFDSPRKASKFISEYPLPPLPVQFAGKALRESCSTTQTMTPDGAHSCTVGSGSGRKFSTGLTYNPRPPCITGQAPEEPLLCQFCEDYSPQKATLSCNECAFLYCGTCFDACHPSKGPLADHTIGPAVARPQKRKETSMQCQQHKEEKLALYCFDCKVPVCYLCKEYGHHKGHQVELLEPVFKNTKVSKTRFTWPDFEQKQLLGEKTRRITTKRLVFTHKTYKDFVICSRKNNFSG